MLLHFTTRECALFRAKARFCAFYYKPVCFVQSKSTILCILLPDSVLCSEQKQNFCAFYYQTVCFVQSKSRTFVHFTTRQCALFKAKAGFCAFYYEAVCFVQSKSRFLCILLQLKTVCSFQSKSRIFVHFTTSWCALFIAKASFCVLLICVS